MNLKVTPQMSASTKAAINKLAGKPLEYGSKAIGVVALSAILYDAHINGKEGAIVKDDIDTANRVYNQYNNYLKSSTGSATVAKMKNTWYQIRQSFPFDHSTSKILGYLGGFGMTLAKNMHIIGLSALAILAKKPTVAKVAGSMVGIYGAKVVADDVLINRDKRKIFK